MKSDYLATQAIEDAYRLMCSFEEAWTNDGARLTTEAKSALILIQLAKEKMDYALTRLRSHNNNRSNEELLQEYLESIRARRTDLGNDERRIRAYLSHLRSKRLAETDFRDVRNFADGLAEKGLRERTIGKYLSHVQGFYGFLVQYHGYEHVSLLNINKIKAREYRSKIPSPFKRHPLSKEDVIKIIQAAKPIRDKLIIALFYYTGLRLGELASLRLNDVEVEKGLIHVMRGKGNKERWVRYSKEDLGMLVDLWLKERGSYPNADDHFFLSRHPWQCKKKGSKINSKGIQVILHNAAKRAGVLKVVGTSADGKPLYNVSPHVLRHTFATHAIEDGVRFEDIQRLMGHSKPSTTWIYAHPQNNVFASYERFQGLSKRRFSPRPDNEKSKRR